MYLGVIASCYSPAYPATCMCAFQAEALHVLKRQNAALKAATAKFDEYLGAADGEWVGGWSALVTHTQVLLTVSSVMRLTSRTGR
jgi:hypothetical protein